MLRVSQLLLAAIVAVAAATPAAARTTLDVSVGWDGSTRGGRWMPLFVTVSDPVSRQVRIELDMPQSGPYVMQLRQFATVGPQPTTLTLYVPAQSTYSDPPTVNIRDAETGKQLARWPEDADSRSGRYEMTVRSNQHFVGVSGPVLRLAGLEQSMGVEMRVGGIKPDLLPDQPVGYDMLDLLVLAQADLTTIERSRQQAIADWVRQGGCLLLWPSPEPTPATSPVGQILPCRVGGPKNFRISDGQRSAAGLQARFTGIVGYELTPEQGAQSIELFRAGAEGDAITAYAWNHGFGRVIVSPINLNEIYFNRTSSGHDFFKPLLIGTPLRQTESSSGGSYYGYDPVVQRQQNAISLLQDHLADVPGAGRFGFSYVVWVVLGMMAVVGPIDWFVLRRLGRQPWTWVTTTGWIAAITIGALYIGQIFKSGDLHFRTVTLVDQADDQTLARTTLLGIYSPQTTEYDIDAVSSQRDAQGNPVPTLQPPAGWWEPASATQYGGGGMKVDVPFRQTTEGNLPQTMTINVWNMRLLRGENMVAGEPIIKADLTYVEVEGRRKPRRVRGTITNLSKHPLKDLRIVVAGGSVAPPGRRPEPAPRPEPRPIEEYDMEDVSRNEGSMIQSVVLVPQLDPGQTVQIDGEVVAGETLGSRNDENMSRRYYREAAPPDPKTIWATATSMSGRRAMRVYQMVSSGQYAAIYATVDGADRPAVLRKDEGAIERHETVVRAVVRLKNE